MNDLLFRSVTWLGFDELFIMSLWVCLFRWLVELFGGELMVARTIALFVFVGLSL